jgi:hypothetical protein
LKHFINQELLAPNVLTIPVDPGVVGEFAELARTAEADPEYCTIRPSWNSDIRWISADTMQGFATFQSAFDRIDVARHTREYLDVEREVRLYAGFLHTRTQCSEPNFHVDWSLTNNEAFTLLTPVCGLGEGQKLLYKKLTGEVAEYAYKPGEAIVFGDHFIHSTPPGSCDPAFTLLVFNFGTDKMNYWDKIRRTAGTQCRLICRPDGDFVRSKATPENDVDNSAATLEKSQSIEDGF